MLKLILAYIMSLALGAGAAELPAVPENMSYLTVENVIVSIDGESYPLDSRLLMGAAVGEKEALLNFCLENSGSRLFPIHAKITEEELMFAISEVGSAFRITDEAIVDMLGIPDDFLPDGDETDDVNVFLNGVNLTGGMAEIPPEEMEKVAAAVEEFLAAHEDAAVSEGSISMGGAEYPGRTIVIENCVPAILDLADYVAEHDFGAVSEEFKALMAEYRHLLDEDMDSFRDIFTFEDEIPNIRMEYTGADIGGDRAREITLFMNEDEMRMELNSFQYQGRETTAVKAVMREADYISEIQLDYFMEEPEDGETMAAQLNAVINDSYDMGMGSRFCNTMNIKFDADVNEELGTLNFCFEDIQFDRFSDGSTVYNLSENYDLGVELIPAGDDVHISAGLTADLEGRDLDLGLEMDLTHGEEPCTDPFEGKKIVDFASEQELMESGQFISDSMGFAIDAMRIGMTTDASRFAAMAQQLTSPPPVDAEEYAAMGAEFGVQLPEFHLPEGWIMQDVDIFRDELKIFCTSDDEEYIDVTVTRAGEDFGRIGFMLLNEEGRLVPAEGSVVEYIYGFNGDVRGATLYRDGLLMQFDFYYVDADLAESVVGGLTWAE